MPRDGLQVKVEGARELRRELARASDDLDDLTAAHAAAAEVIGRAAASGAPKRTGRLARSGTSTGSKAGAAVDFAAPYARPVHWGVPSRGQRAQPFLSEATERTQPQWVAAYEREVNRILSRVRGAGQ